MSAAPSTRAQSALAIELYDQGVDLMASGEAAAAADRFREALAADPEMLDAMHGLVRVLGSAGDYEAATAMALELVARAPDDPLPHTSLSILYQHRGMVPEAEAEALKAKLLGWKLELRELRPAQ